MNEEVISRIKNLDCKGLAGFLRPRLKPDVVQMIEDQKIHGEDFLSLSDEDLKLFHFPLGFVKAIRTLIDSLTAQKALSLREQATTEKAVENEEEENQNDERDMILLQYMSQEALNEIGEYEKKNLLSKVILHEKMVELGYSTASNPIQNDVTEAQGKARKRAKEKAQEIAQKQPKKVVSIRSPISSEEEEDNEPQGMFKPSNHITKTSDELKKIKSHLQIFDIEEILSRDEKAKTFIAALKDGFCLAPNDRKVVFRALMRFLCWTFVSHPSEATMAMREGLAKSFVCTFRQYQKPIDVDQKTPWSHVFDPSGRGHFANIMKRIQTALPKTDRQRGKYKKKAKVTADDSSSHNVNIAALAILYNGRAEKPEILEGMANTFQLRCRERARGMSITELLQKYPHLLSYSGEVLSQEFKKICPQAKDMCPAFLMIAPRIEEKWGKSSVPVLKCKDEVFKACYLLASNLPHVITRKRNSAQPIDDPRPTVTPKEEELFIVLATGVDVEDFIETRRVTIGKAVQPYLIGVKARLSQDILKTFLVLDNSTLDLGKVAVIRAIDWLFKAYVVFNVDYPDSWSPFFRFLQTILYQVFFSKNDDAPASAVEIASELMS